MTFTAQFAITEVDEEPASDKAGITIWAKASTLPGVEGQPEFGTLTQNTEHAVRMELRIELEPDQATSLRPGDVISVHGHFTA